MMPQSLVLCKITSFRPSEGIFSKKLRFFPKGKILRNAFDKKCEWIISLRVDKTFFTKLLNILMECLHKDWWRTQVIWGKTQYYHHLWSNRYSCFILPIHYNTYNTMQRIFFHLMGHLESHTLKPKLLWSCIT